MPYWVDLPLETGIDNPDESWHNVRTFDKKEDAIAFVREHWGADEKGNVCLVAEG